MPADLHIHSNFSDGTNSPEEIVELAKKGNLTKISLTDHDTVSGITRAVNKGNEIGLNVIPGIEFTTEIPKCEIHILGYFIDINNEALLDKLKQIQYGRKERIYKMVEKLSGLGVKISAEDVFAFAGNDSPGRPHVARALIKSGAISNFKEAFDRYISFNGSAYVSHYKLSPFEAIELIRQIKGVPVFAHPAISNCDEVIPDLIAAGLKGIEVFYSGHREEEVQRYKSLANKYGLITTGGSDFHGTDSWRMFKLGDISISDEIVEKLKDEHLRGN